MKRFLFWNIESPEERKMRQEITARVMEATMAEIKKQQAYQKLTAQTLNYDILWDLIKTAQFTGRVEIKLADGTLVNLIDDTAEARQALNRKPHDLDGLF